MLTVMSPYGLNLMLADIKTDILTAPGLLVKLFQNNIVPTPASVVADFTIATFDGYVDKAVTVMFGPTRNPDGSFAIRNFLNWTMSGSTTPNQIYGIFVLDRLGTLLYSSRFVNAPWPMIDAFSDLSIENEIAMNAVGLLGGATVIT